MTMGTASTMAAAVEALGLTLPGGVVHSRRPTRHHPRMASAAGRRIVEMVWEDLKPRDILTTEAFENAVTAAMALGGSTNAIIHLIAMAGRAGAALDLDRFDALSRRTPFLANIRPSGKFLMEDFYLRRRPARRARCACAICCTPDCVTVNGRTLGENIEGAMVCNDEVIAPREQPIGPEGGVAVLRGNLAPDGAVIKHTAAERRLLQHAGPAVVFTNYNDLAARIDDPALPVTADSVLVLQNAGPLGAPGHARVGHAADPEEAAGAGRARHGAHLRRAHERHELRRLRAARRAGVVRRRPARLRPRRRHHRARRAGAPAVAARLGRGARAAPRRLDAARGRLPARLRPPLRRSTSRRPTRAATSISSRARRRSGSRRFIRRRRRALRLPPPSAPRLQNLQKRSALQLLQRQARFPRLVQRQRA